APDTQTVVGRARPAHPRLGPGSTPPRGEPDPRGRSVSGRTNRIISPESEALRPVGRRPPGGATRHRGRPAPLPRTHSLRAFSGCDGGRLVGRPRPGGTGRVPRRAARPPGGRAAPVRHRVSSTEWVPGAPSRETAARRPAIGQHRGLPVSP